MLTLLDREEISRGLAEDLQFTEITRRIGRDPSVVSRDVARYGCPSGYRAVRADQAARDARERPKKLAVDRSPRLRTIVTGLLREGWSPASIAGRLPTDYPDDQACRVSHEAIYQWIYATPVSSLVRELIALRTKRTGRRGGRRPDPGTADQGADLHRRPARRGRGPSGARALGRRPGHRQGRPLRGRHR